MSVKEKIEAASKRATAVEEQFSAGRQKMEEVQQQAQELIDYYRKLQTISLPDLIIEIGDDVDVATEFLVKKLPREIFALWNTRAIKIEKVNEALVDFEFGLVDELTLTTTSIWFEEVQNVFGIFEWIAGHTGELTLLLAAAFGWVSGRYGSDIDIAGRKALDGILSLDLDKVTSALADVVIVEAKAIEFIVESAALALVASVLQGALAGFSSAIYVDKLVKVVLLKAATENELMKSAFPQGKGRVRRRKRHRIRKK